MTTPQNQLYYLADKVKDLYEMFKCDEDEQDIFANVKQLYMTVQLLDKRLDMLQDQMAIIIKLLSKDK